MQGKSPPVQVKEPYGNLDMGACRISSCSPECTDNTRKRVWHIYRNIYIAFEEKVSAFQQYEGRSDMNAISFITYFTYMLRQNGKRFLKGLFVTFKLAPDRKKNTVYLSRYSPSNEGHVSILTDSMLRTYTSDIDERIILR